MHEIVRTVAQHAATVLEGIAVLFILIGVAGAVLIYIRKTFFVKTDYRVMAHSRNHLGHSLSLALEFLIGADILRTAVSPSWEDIGKLAAIVGIRVVLNFFLSRELKHMDAMQ